MRDDTIRAELAKRGAIPSADQSGHYWFVRLTDGTTCQITFGDTSLFGPVDEWSWYVAHCDVNDFEIGGGDWDFAGALASLDGYIKDPGWDRATA